MFRKLFPALFLVVTPFCVATAQESNEVDALLACASIEDPAARLACFDAKIAEANAAPSPPASNVTPPTTAVPTITPVEPGTRPAEAPSPTPASSIDTAPDWARAPEPDKEKQAFEEQPNRLDVEIVKITRTRGNRLRFYTSSDQVWEQLIKADEFDLPDSLPAEATIRRRIVGKPVIKFPHRNRSYKVRRIR